MKNSRTHKFNSREGWCWTDFVNGRSKLRGAKKNSRPWKQWSICWCKGGKHVSPTLKAKWNIDETGNPMNPPATMPIDTYEVRIEGDTIEVAV